jgi:hypothetical protein
MAFEYPDNVSRATWERGKGRGAHSQVASFGGPKIEGETPTEELNLIVIQELVWVNASVIAAELLRRPQCLLRPSWMQSD